MNDKKFEVYFWKKISKEKSGCWIWLGTKNEYGYGRINRGNKKLYAHRVAYNLANSVILQTKEIVRHICHNTSCINPDHLEIGTQKDNIDDKVKANRQHKGEKSPSSKLTENKVIELRKRYWINRESISDLANESKVKVSTLHECLQSKTWKHIPNFIRPRKNLNKNKQ